MTKTFCDLCEREVVLGDYIIIGQHPHTTKVEYDLCGECRRALAELLGNLKTIKK